MPKGSRFLRRVNNVSFGSSFISKLFEEKERAEQLDSKLFEVCHRFSFGKYKQKNWKNFIENTGAAETGGESEGSGGGAEIETIRLIRLSSTSSKFLQGLTKRDPEI